ncbi:hypothetical protein OSCI_720002 [Kamptonema sp. PCC 6506]|nr:hypothetical protein OSCI_720002 [Kamptonema sp. PCC 6506]
MKAIAENIMLPEFYQRSLQTQLTHAQFVLLKILVQRCCQLNSSALYYKLR